jgi:hypothetical protein
MWCRVIAVFSGFAVLASAMVGASEASAAAAPSKRFEVLVVATLPAPWIFRSPNYTPAHVRAALKIAKPDVIAIATSPENLEQKHFLIDDYVSPEVVLPFAQDKDIPLVGVDDVDETAWDLHQRDSRQSYKNSARNLLKQGPLPLDSFGTLTPDDLTKAKIAFANRNLDFARLNTTGVKTDRGIGLSYDPNRAVNPSQRVDSIVDRCVQKMHRYRGKRLVLVADAAFKRALDARFATIEGVRVLSFGKDVHLPSNKKVAAAWTDTDMLAILGHGLDGEDTYFHVELIGAERMTRIANRLATRKNHKEAADYFRARLSMVGGHSARAAEELAKLTESVATDPLYPFPMNHWRMMYTTPDAIKIETAWALENAGRDAEAAKVLRPIADDIRARYDDRLRKAPTKSMTVAAIGDPGFESGRLADSPSDGWYCEGVKTGTVRADFTSQKPLKGDHALCLEIVEKSAGDPPSLRHELRIPEEAIQAGTPKFKIAVLPKGASVRWSLCVWDKSAKKMIEFAEKTLSASSAMWLRSGKTLRFPPEYDTVHLFLYLEGPVGSGACFDDATPLETTIQLAPPQWKALTLAKEFPRTLLRLAGDD